MSPSGHVFGNALLDVGLHMPGSGRSILLWIIDKHSKLGRPFSVALLRHYVEGSGAPFDLNTNMGAIPDQWQRWMVASTNAKPGRYHLDPYHAVLAPPHAGLCFSLPEAAQGVRSLLKVSAAIL